MVYFYFFLSIKDGFLITMDICCFCFLGIPFFPFGRCLIATVSSLSAITKCGANSTLWLQEWAWSQACLMRVTRGLCGALMREVFSTGIVKLVGGKSGTVWKNRAQRWTWLQFRKRLTINVAKRWRKLPMTSLISGAVCAYGCVIQ